MNNNLFDSAIFNMGWEIKTEISLFERVCPIIVSASAYYEHEKVTEAQNDTYKDFLENKIGILQKIEDLLIQETGDKESAKSRFVPAMLIIKTNGDCGMLFDDKCDFENGTVVCIKPNFEIMTSDQYL